MREKRCHMASVRLCTSKAGTADKRDDNLGQNSMRVARSHAP